MSSVWRTEVASGTARSSARRRCSILPRDPRHRPRVLDVDPDVRIVLVVAQLGVVARLLLADEVVLPDQRLDRRLGQDVLQPTAPGASSGWSFGWWVWSKLVLGWKYERTRSLQRLRLADVQQPATSVLEQVDTPEPVRQVPSCSASWGRRRSGISIGAFRADFCLYMVRSRTSCAPDRPREPPLFRDARCYHSSTASSGTSRLRKVLPLILAALLAERPRARLRQPATPTT